MGNGSITYTRQLSVLKAAFRDKPDQVYIASYQADPSEDGNLHVARRFDFNTLLPRAVALINHGGQNSILTGIMAGVTQLIFPGNIFERQYNATSVQRLGLGKSFSDACFRPDEIERAVGELRQQTDFLEKVGNMQARLRTLGGVDQVVKSLSRLCVGSPMVA